jgi:hypothetical protein
LTAFAGQRRHRRSGSGHRRTGAGTAIADRRRNQHTEPRQPTGFAAPAGPAAGAARPGVVGARRAGVDHGRGRLIQLPLAGFAALPVR